MCRPRRADGWEQIAEYGRRKRAFFRRFLPLAHGIPSHDTFYRLFCAPDPAAFAAAFGRWMAAACDGTGLVPVAIDGQAVRGAVRGNATGGLCVVSAWATANRLTLGQVAVPDGTSEIGVIPALLRTLDLAGALVTVDAAGCQTGAVRDGGVRPGRVAGRVDRRGGGGAGEPGAGGERGADGDDPLRPDQPRRIAGRVGRVRPRPLGGIENGLHWVLDVAFREDESRTRNLNSGANLALLRRVAVSLRRRAPGKGSIHTKRLMAAWDDEFLLTVLQGIPAEHSA